ncbi:MAG TPA: sugar phosphate nucleotidyltransferase [Candidatus Saccharimonadales bacterium]|nr:sugar phosphate nucleotidyltransferase [Candidatus Saccharimonadales bacterium]
MKLIVTAGGQGTKLWPYSRGNKPKQFQPIIGDKSLYTETIETLLKAFPAEDIFISTKRKFIKYVSEQSPQIPLKNYIIEPDVAKDRGPGEGLAFLRLSVSHPGEPFFVVQADCVRSPETAFLDMITAADKIVAKEKKYITGGIKATEPNLGVDYLQLGERLSNGYDQEVYHVSEFLGRRSSYRETRELIENYHIVTHCNHSCWYPELMLEAYKKYRPDWYKALMEMRDAFNKPGEDAAIEAIYQEMEKGATEEVTRHAMKDGMIILLPFKWTDIGTWGSVYEFFVDGDGSNNYKDGKVVTVDSSGCIVKSNDKDKLIALAGVQDIVVIDTEDALLVIPKEQMEKIKEIQTILARGEDSKYL